MVRKHTNTQCTETIFSSLFPTKESSYASVPGALLNIAFAFLCSCWDMGPLHFGLRSQHRCQQLQATTERPSRHTIRRCSQHSDQHSVVKMKFATVISIFALTTIVAANDHQHAIKCGSKNPNVNAAIQNFCNFHHDHIRVPGHYAKAGRRSGNIHVSIHGHCSPRGFVHPAGCNAKFHEICATGKDGLGTMRHGKNGCENWLIERH